MKPVVIFLSVLLICSFACRPGKVHLIEGSGSMPKDLTIRFSFRDDQRKQNGKINWLFDDSRSRMLFFTPFNQVLFELHARQEEVILINRKKRLFWKGNFRELLKRFWNLEFTLAEIKTIVSEGILPSSASDGSFHLSSEFDEQTKQVRRVELSEGDTRLILRVTGRKIGRKILFPTQDLADFQPAGLEELFNDD